MKEQIEKLIELAKEYVVFGEEIMLPQNHTDIRDKDISSKNDAYLDGSKITIYFNNNYSTWQVSFGKVKIIGYAKDVQIPFDCDSEMLEMEYNSAKDYLYNHLLPNVAKCKISSLKEKHKRIKELEAELRKLKSLT